MAKWPGDDPKKNEVYEVRADGSLGSEPDQWKARLSVIEKAIKLAKST